MVDRAIADISGSSAFTLVANPTKPGEIALFLGGFGSKSFKGPNDAVVVAHCADEETCKAAMTAMHRPAFADPAVVGRVPFATCGVPAETTAFGALSLVAPRRP